MTAAGAIRDALGCGRHGCECASPRGHTHCPAHDDDRPSLSVDERGGKLLVLCRAGCEQGAVVDALSRRGLWAAQVSGNGHTRVPPIPSRSDCNTATVPQTPSAARDSGGGTVAVPDATPRNTATVGCTLQAYSDRIRVPTDYLRSLGVGEMYHRGYGCQVVRIPHYAPDGTVAATLYRVALSGGDSKRWKAGDKATLYGLERLDRARQAGHLVLCEGQSDCHTLWHCGIPALGLPGAGGGWAGLTPELLAGIGTIDVVLEPDTGGEAVMRRLAGMPWRDRAQLVRMPTEHKDPSALHVADPEGFGGAWQSLIDVAEPYAEYEHRELQRHGSAAWELCRELAVSPDILSRVAGTVAALGVAGEGRAVRLLYLAVVSRLLVQGRPVSIALKGPSSAGKSFTAEQVLKLLPASAYYALSAMSERALAYSEEPLQHRMLVIYEAAGLSGDFASYLMRSLLSEGRIRYETVMKTADGMQARFIEREGPTGLIVTTTALRLHPENETRLLSVPVRDDRDQTREVMRALASESGAEPDLSAWHALSDWLEGGERRVSMPYAVDLAEHVSPAAVRLRRDFGALLSLIRAHALLHRASRDRDAQGRIVATLADYATVRELVHDLVAEGAEASVSETTRETVGGVAGLDKEAGVSVAELGRALKLDKGSASRRARAAADRGYLRNLEDRRGKPARYVPDEPMPDEVDILPAPEVLQRCAGVAGGSATVGRAETQEGRGITGTVAVLQLESGGTGDTHTVDAFEVCGDCVYPANCRHWRTCSHRLVGGGS